MNFITYKDINENKNFNLELEKINKLIFNNDRNIDNNYFIVSIPKLELNKNKKSIYVQIENGLDYKKEIDLIIPFLYLHKIIFFNKENKLYCVYDNDTNPFIKKENINLYLELIFDTIDNEIQKIYRLTYDIKKSITHIDFYVAYKLVECIDKLILYTGFYISFINDLSNTKIKLEKGTENKILNIKEVIKHLIDILNNTRHAVMQRIAYLDSGTVRILTIIATIFLPASFLISIVSMDLYDNPLKKIKKPFISFLLLLLIIFIILLVLFRKDLKMLF